MLNNYETPSAQIVRSRSFSNKGYIYTEYIFDNGSKVHTYHPEHGITIPKLVYEEIFKAAAREGTLISETGGKNG